MKCNNESQGHRHFPKSLHLFPSSVLTRYPKWPPQCWWSMVRRTKSSTSPTVWQCTSAAHVLSSLCGWRELATTTSNFTPSTWRDSSSLSPLSFPPREGSRALRPGVHLNALKKPPPHHLPTLHFSSVGGLELAAVLLSLALFHVGMCSGLEEAGFSLDCQYQPGLKLRLYL